MINKLNNLQPLEEKEGKMYGGFAILNTSEMANVKGGDSNNDVCSSNSICRRNGTCHGNSGRCVGNGQCVNKGSETIV